MVTWSDPGTGLVARFVALTSRTAIRMVQRRVQANADRAAMPGWEARMIDATAVRSGDFVTVTMDDDRRNGGPGRSPGR